jgi:DNA repair protein RadA/Sms
VENLESKDVRRRFKSNDLKISSIVALAAVNIEAQTRLRTGLSELDRVLGGGLVPGSVVLLGGDPGIGKTTLLLQSMVATAEDGQLKSLYVSGEESASQLAIRARRLGLPLSQLNVLTETNVDIVLEEAAKNRPLVLVVDSIQTMYTEDLQSTPGSVAQVRECAGRLVGFAKSTGIAIYLVGHVTKDGAIAGPRVLEHMVDVTLYFEGDPDGLYRMIRAIKNRFGAVNELGVFAMTDQGLREVANPSAILLSRHEKPVPGSVIMVTREGTRPMLVEVQALLNESQLMNPRRVTVGLDQNRLSMLLAVLNRHCGVVTGSSDVFANIVGGIRVGETGADLAIAMAVMSSLGDKALPSDMITFGEIGLAGEIRPVSGGAERLKEAAKHGFKSAIIPIGNVPKVLPQGMRVKAVSRLGDALKVISSTEK